MEMRDRRWDEYSATSTERVLEPPRSVAAPYGLDGDAVASAIAHISRLVADSLEPVGWGLALHGGGAGAPDSLLRALIQIDAITSLYRRLSSPPCPAEPIEDYCRALCCDVVLAFGRLEIRPRLTMCDAPCPAPTNFASRSSSSN
jgi:hypothetical protein